MTVTVKPVGRGDSFILENVVSINYILGEVLIQYIADGSPRTARFSNDGEVRISAIIL